MDPSHVALALSSAQSWVVEQGWSVENYRIQLSDLQSSPLGFLNVDVICNESDGADRLIRSRVLEVEASTGKIETVLAARDPEKLQRMVELERVKVKTELMQTQLEERRETPNDGAADDLDFRSLLLEEV